MRISDRSAVWIYRSGFRDIVGPLHMRDLLRFGLREYCLCNFSLWEVLAFFFRGGWVRNGAARWWNHCSHLIFLYGSLFCWQTKRWKFMLADWCLLGCDAVNISSLPYLHCKKKILNSWLLCWHHNCVLFKDPTTRNGIVTLVWNNSKYMCSCRPCVSKCSLFSDWWL